MRISGFVDKCWSLCCSTGSQYILWHVPECHLGRPFNDMFCCKTIISLMISSATHKTNIICDKNSLSPKLCTRQPLHVSPPLDAGACLPVLVTLPVPCREEKPRVLWGPRDKDPCPWSCQGSQRQGESVFLLKFFRHQFHPTTGGRREGRSQESGKWHGILSVVGFCHLRSTRKWKPIKAECHSLPQALTSSQVCAFYWLVS